MTITDELRADIRAAVHSPDPVIREEAVARLIERETAELRGDVELLTGRVEAAEDSENLIRDTLAKRSAVVNTLGAENERVRARLEAVRALADTWERTRGGIFGAAHVMELRAALDGGHCEGHGGPGRRYCCQHPDAGWPCREVTDGA